MKKLFTFLFALIAGIGIASSATSGTCGDNLTWELSDDGVLTISGTGNMNNYSWNNNTKYFSPWYSNRNSIHTVIINDGVTSIGDDAFEKCSSLTSITIPNSVTSIGKYAFNNCYRLTSVTIPNSVTSIGEGAFYECFLLIYVHISDIAAWCQISFYDVDSNPLYYANNLYLNGELVTDLIIPNNVTSIGKYAFYGYSKLSSVTIGDGVTSIGKYAFQDCSKLTSVTIPNSVTKIGDGAFKNCSGLTSVTIGNSVRSIGGSAFQDCSKLTSVTIPSSVTTIGDGAFEGCSNITSVTWNAKNCNSYNFGSQVTSFEIGNEVEVIPSSLCQGMTKLTSITIPNSVTSIGSSAFDYCSSLTSVTLTAASEEEFCKGQGNYLLLFDAEVTCQRKIQINGTEVTEFTIPNSVTIIDSFTFWNCSSLTSVTIPNSVTDIGYFAFLDCSSLKSVHILDIAAWCQINFYVNSDYYSYDYSANPLYYAKNLYLNGELVTDLVIPNSVTSIGNHAFACCHSLTSVTIPNSVTNIGDGAFGYCSSLTSVTIGNSVTSIGDDAFEGCSKLTSVTIPNSVTSIGYGAFLNCSSLTSATIGNSVTSIGKEAFGNCNKLYDVYCYATTPPTADQSSFANYNAFLHVLCDNQRMYLLDVVFGNFKYVECLGAEEVMTDGVTVVPGKNDAVFTWPTEGSAKSYTLEIKKDGMVFCTLTFNANGQLTGIAFMPRPDGSTPAKAATSVGAGYQFTVTGLDGASHYTYKLTTKDAANQVIASYTGEFSTEGFTALEDAVIPSLRVVDGAVVCDEPYTIYDISGRDVTNQNSNLQGVYIVRTAKGAVKVVF